MFNGRFWLRWTISPTLISISFAMRFKDGLWSEEFRRAPRPSSIEQNLSASRLSSDGPTRDYFPGRACAWCKSDLQDGTLTKAANCETAASRSALDGESIQSVLPNTASR